MKEEITEEGLYYNERKECPPYIDGVKRLRASLV